MNSSQVVNNFLWRVFERFGAQIVTFIVSIVLARLLNPEVYGVVAIVDIIIVILNVFIDSGLGSALVQKKEIDDVDYSSVFYFNLFICIFLYLLLFIVSPYIAIFYHIDELTIIVRVLGLTLIISGIKNIQNAYVSRNLIFKKYFYATLFGTVLSAIIGIWMAYNGYGVWSLIFQNLINNLVDTIILWFTVEWRPKLLFSASRLKELFNYGWKLLASSLLDTIWTRLRQLIIGKKYTSSDLAYYNKGNHLPDITTSSIMVSLNSVLFPVLSKMQDDIQTVKEITRKSIRIGSYVLWPMMVGLAVCSDNFVKVFLTEKWLPIVPYLRIFCITYAFYPIHISNLNAIKALGRSDIFLKLEIIKKIIDLMIIVISIRYGVFVMALCTIISSVLSYIINSWPNRKLIGYYYIDQIKDIFPALILSLLMGFVTFIVSYIELGCLFTLILQVIVGVITYIVLSIITKNSSFKYCISYISAYFKK